ncbi:MAG: GYF domain-containing protein [Chthoniobacteraceae bacterium]
MSVERYLWLNDEATGPFTEGKIIRLVARGEACGSTLYWHETSEEWRPLTHFLDDQHAQALEEMRQHKCVAVEFVGARTIEECPECQSIHGKHFPINEAPAIPPPGCHCQPWSKAHLVGLHHS